MTIFFSMMLMHAPILLFIPELTRSAWCRGSVGHAASVVAQQNYEASQAFEAVEEDEHDQVASPPPRPPTSDQPPPRMSPPPHMPLPPRPAARPPSPTPAVTDHSAAVPPPGSSNQRQEQGGFSETSGVDDKPAPGAKVASKYDCQSCGCSLEQESRCA